MNTDPWSGSPSLILTNQQMGSLFGILDYSFVHASHADGASPAWVGSELLGKIRDVPKAALSDHTAAIEAQKTYLSKQQLFFTGIAAVLLMASLFHIMNSMHYLVLSRRREYGILRAMGITDSGLYRMMLQAGILYGLLADLLIFFSFHLILRRFMDYYMVHIVQFLHMGAGVPMGAVAMVFGLNVLLAAVSAMVPAGKIVRGRIASQMQG